jgi:hypothetical protein
VRPPVAGRGAAARRLAQELRRRLAPAERALPGSVAGERAAAGHEFDAPPAQADRLADPTPQDAAARIDAARKRLRATIPPPAEFDAAAESDP